MATDQRINKTAALEAVTPEELRKQGKPSRNPLKWFSNSKARPSRSSSSKGSQASPDPSKPKPVIVVNYFPTTNSARMRL